MSDPAEEHRNRALTKAALAFDLLMGAVGTEVDPREDPDRIEYLRGAMNTALEESQQAPARYPTSTAHEELTEDDSDELA